jgi:hypothetical protein
MKQDSPTWTAAELKRFDRLTMKLSSPRQMDRINARLKIMKLEKDVGEATLQAMFAVLESRDKRRKAR